MFLILYTVENSLGGKPIVNQLIMENYSLYTQNVVVCKWSSS